MYTTQTKFNKGFSVSGCSLKLLKVGERGMVTRFASNNETILRKLEAMEITPGKFITLEQRFPRFVIRNGNDRIALDESTIQAIYVRTTGSGI